MSKDNRTINSDLERFMSKRMGAKTIEVDGGYPSMIVKAEVITDLILEAASRKA